MKSNVINIDNRGNGFEKTIEEARKVAEYESLSHKDSLHLQLCAEEMLSLVRSVTGELKASFWIESEGKTFCLHVATQTVLDKEKRAQLLASSTSGKNEAAKSFLGQLRDLFEQAMTAEPNYNNDLPDDVLSDLANHTIECTDPEWDEYEQSTLKKLANTIKIGIRGGAVDMTVITSFA